jgi:hypothetical protein
MKTARVLILCTVAVLCACHRDSGTSAQPVSAPHVAVPVAVKKGPSAAVLTAGMVEAAAQGKSQLPVEVKFELDQRPKVGQPLGIDIAVLPQIDANGAGIQVSGGDGLSVPEGMSQIELSAVQAGQVYRQSIKVTPTQDGLLVLGLTVSLKHDEMTDSRSFSIPVIAAR